MDKLLQLFAKKFPGLLEWSWQQLWNWRSSTQQTKLKLYFPVSPTFKSESYSKESKLVFEIVQTVTQANLTSHYKFFISTHFLHQSPEFPMYSIHSCMWHLNAKILMQHYQILPATTGGKMSCKKGNLRISDSQTEDLQLGMIKKKLLNKSNQTGGNHRPAPWTMTGSWTATQA